MNKRSTFTSVQINLEKLKLLISGSVDDGEFNSKVKQIRKTANISEKGMRTIKERKEWSNRACEQLDQWQRSMRKLDKSDPDFLKKKHKINMKCDAFLVRQSAKDLVANNPDLTENFVDSIIGYIKFGKKILPIPNNYQIVIQERNEKRIPTLELYGELTALEHAEVKKLMKMQNQDEQYFARHRSIEELDKSLKIKKLSKKRGSRLKSTNPDIEKDGKYTDQSIVSKVIKEQLDTITRKKTNQDQIRQKRHRLEVRTKKLFPNTYKK